MISIVLGRGGDDAALIFPASDFACRGIALPRAESQDLMTIVDGGPRPAAGDRAIQHRPWAAGVA